MTPDDISSSCWVLSRQLPRPSQDHQPRPRHWRYAVWLVAGEWRHCSTGRGFPRDHCSARLPSVQTLACQPRPSHHQLYCLLYIYTQNRKPLIIIYYKIFLFPRNKEAFPKYQQLHLSTVNCSSSLPQSSHHSDHSPCGKP